MTTFTQDQVNAIVAQAVSQAIAQINSNGTGNGSTGKRICGKTGCNGVILVDGKFCRHHFPGATGNGSQPVNGKVSGKAATVETFIPLVRNLKVRQSIDIGRLTRKQIHALWGHGPLGAGGTWTGTAWKANVNDTYVLDGKRFRFTNVSSARAWKASQSGNVISRDRRITRLPD